MKNIVGIIITSIIILAPFAFILAMPVKSEPDYVEDIIVIHRGDTLLGYAHEYAPSMNAYRYVTADKERNGMKSGMIYAGEEIVILKEVGR